MSREWGDDILAREEADAAFEEAITQGAADKHMTVAEYIAYCDEHNADMAISRLETA